MIVGRIGSGFQRFQSFESLAARQLYAMGNEIAVSTVTGNDLQVNTILYVYG
jgi:hypothetical protein